MTLHFSRDRTAVLAGLLVPVGMAAILLPWRASWSNTNVALLLVVVVVAVAAIGNRIAGALAAVSSFAWFDFFYTRPYERFTIHGSADITTAVLLLVVGLAVSQLAARARQLRVVAITDAGYLAQIREAASMATSADAAETVVDSVREQLISCWTWRTAVSSTAPCSVTRLAWSPTAPWSPATAAGTWSTTASRRGRSSCAPSATVSTMAAS
jgi:K+-sensing histidine kinase KdpD